jgi:hypothetical protein
MKVPYKCNEVIEETTNPDDGEIKIKAVAQLQSITNQLEQYYVQLPSVAKAGTMDTNTLFPSSSISAAAVPIPSATSTSSSSSSSLSEEDNYKKRFCKNCNKMHALDKDGDKKCPQWRVGLPSEEEPGYYDRDD